MSCKTINIDLTNVPPVPIQIGVAGENSFRTITFDASKWGAGYPDATYTVVYRRSDGYLYPVLVNASADAIVWNPTGTDTAVSGNGQLEVRLLDGETIGKTIIMQTYVAPSLSGDESEPSTPAPDWVNDVADDADRAELATSHYPKIVNGVWYVWSVPDGDFVSTGIEAQGEDGYSPTVTVTEIDGGHRVTITDADGAHTFDVMDGEGGSGFGAVESVNGMTGAVVLDASDVGALPANTPIPAAVTEQTVAGWGFTKNTGTYSKPASGIPASDLAAGVIPTVPQLATEPDMTDWTSGKTVDAATMKTMVTAAGLNVAALEDDVSELERDKANASDVYTKTEVDQKIVGAMDYKGTKATVSALPTSGNKTGDVWHITADGSEWAWNGSAWEELGSAVDLSGYRTASAQDAIDAAQNTAIAAKYTKPSGGIPKSDLAPGVQTSLGKADTALQTSTLQTVLDDNVPPARFVLVMNGNTLTTVDQFISIANLLVNTPRRVMFIIVVSQSGGTVTSALELYPTMIDTDNRAMTLVGYFNGVRYTAELTAASVSSTMTGTLVVGPIVTISDIPAVSTAAPLMDGTAAAGTSDAYAREDHVHPSDTTRLAVNQGAANAGKFMVVGNDGNIAPVTMTAWQGGSY